MGQALEGLRNQGARTPNRQSPHWVPWNSCGARGLWVWGPRRQRGLFSKLSQALKVTPNQRKGPYLTPGCVPALPEALTQPTFSWLRPDVTCPNSTPSFPLCEMGSTAAMHGCLGQKVRKSTGGSGAQCPVTGRLQEGSSEAVTQSWA